MEIGIVMYYGWIDYYKKSWYDMSNEYLGKLTHRVNIEIHMRSEFGYETHT